MMNSAILIASKSQILTTVKGEKIRGIGLEFTQIIRTCKIIDIEEFIFILKDFIRTINLDIEVEREIELLTQKFSFLLKIYTKYEKIFNKLDIRVIQKRHGDLLHQQQDQVQMLRNFGWLIFIDANRYILHGKAEVVETTYLLATILNFIIQNKPPSITIGIFENNNVDKLQHLCDLFKMQDQDRFTTTNIALQNRFKDV